MKTQKDSNDLQAKTGELYSEEDIKRVKKFLNRENMYKTLKRMVSFFIPHKDDVGLTLNIGGGSFTDGKSITVGLPKIFIPKSEEEIYSALLALTGHEAQHGATRF